MSVKQHMILAKQTELKPYSYTANTHKIAKHVNTIIGYRYDLQHSQDV